MENTNESYLCEKCQKSFKSKYTLKSHIEKSKCNSKNEDEKVEEKEMKEMKENYDTLQKEVEELKRLNEKQANELSSRDKDVRHIKEMYIKCLMEDIPRYKSAIYEKDRILRVYKELLRIALISIFRMEEESEEYNRNEKNEENDTDGDGDDGDGDDR